MIDIEFKFRVRSEPSGSFSYRDNTSTLGDGYSVTSGDGINTENQSWSISCTSAFQECGGAPGEAVLAFQWLRERKKNAESFPWTTPLGDLIRVQAGSLSPKRAGATYTVSTTFTQVYR